MQDQPRPLTSIALPDVAANDLFDAWFANTDWSQLPLVSVPTRSLIPTQSHVLIEGIIALLNGGAYGYPYVVLYNGAYYMYDGHHRWLVALVLDEPNLLVRVAEVSNDSQ